MVRRYGLSGKRMRRTLTQMSEDARSNGIGMTVPVVGKIITDKRAVFLRSIVHEKFELAVHGFSHDDLSLLSQEALRGDIEKAVSVFKERGISVSGFRAPYLRSGEGMMRSLSEMGFEYTSTRPYVPKVPGSTGSDILDRGGNIASEVYGKQVLSGSNIPIDSSSGTLDIPVSLPDDEILVDRMGLQEGDQLEAALTEVIAASLKLNPIAVIQIHPERYFIFRGILLSIARKLSREESVSFLTLGEAARRLKSLGATGHDNVKIVCVTGDLDIISLYDLMR